VSIAVCNHSLHSDRANLLFDSTHKRTSFDLASSPTNIQTTGYILANNHVTFLHSADRQCQYSELFSVNSRTVGAHNIVITVSNASSLAYDAVVAFTTTAIIKMTNAIHR